MPKEHNPLIIIPARMASNRLPGKPLADIGGAPMIVQVWRRAMEAGVGEVLVACDGEEIAHAVKKAGGRAALTDPDLPSGSDRVWQALQKQETPEQYDIIINLQGDMPTLDPAIVRAVLVPLQNEAVDIATLASVITKEEEKTDSAVVKVVMGQNGNTLYFSRSTVPCGDGPLYHHIGIYAYRRKALERFVSLPPSPLEKRERLEQLRALENGMRIDAAVVNTVPLGVDTPKQLEMAREILNSKGEVHA